MRKYTFLTKNMVGGKKGTGSAGRSTGKGTEVKGIREVCFFISATTSVAAQPGVDFERICR